MYKKIKSSRRYLAAPVGNVIKVHLPVTKKRLFLSIPQISHNPTFYHSLESSKAAVN